MAAESRSRQCWGMVAAAGTLSHFAMTLGKRREQARTTHHGPSDCSRTRKEEWEEPGRGRRKIAGARRFGTRRKASDRLGHTGREQAVEGNSD